MVSKFLHTNLQERLHAKCQKQRYLKVMNSFILDKPFTKHVGGELDQEPLG